MDEGPRNIDWTMGLILGHLIVQGQVNVSKEVQISELWKDPSHEGLGRSFEEKCLLGLTE